MICPHCNHENYPGVDSCIWCLLDLSSFDVPIPQDRIEKSLVEDPVSILKPSPAVLLHASTTVAQAIQVMLDQNVGAILVVNDASEIAGIFSERDLLTRVSDDPTGYHDRPVSDYMTANPETVKVGDKLAFVLHKMDGGSYRHIPVLKDGKPVGMISVRDMLRHILGLCRK